MSQTNISPLICIVEDDAFLQKLYKLSCDQAGLNVVYADSKQILQDVITQNKPDLILLDLILPDADGFTVLKELKTNSTTATIPVIILSNLAQPEDREKAKQLGAEDYLVKADLSFDQIVELIKARFS